MKRFSTEHVECAAKEFAASTIALTSWRLFGATIQRALIDSFVMQLLQQSHVADSTHALTPTEIIEFRDALAARLADPKGIVPAGRRDARTIFKVDE